MRAAAHPVLDAGGGQYSYMPKSCRQR